MKNRQNSNYILFLADKHKRISQWRQIKLACRIVHMTYRVIRSVRQYPSENMKKRLKHLKAILKNLKLPPTNPFHYWVNSQLCIHTNGMKFHTIWYEMTKETPQEIN